MSLEVTNLPVGVYSFVEVCRTIVTFEFQCTVADHEFEAVLGEFLLYLFGCRGEPGIPRQLYEGGQNHSLLGKLG